MHDSTWKVLCVTGPERWNLLGGQDKTSQIKTNCCLIITLKTCDSQGIYLATHTHTAPGEIAAPRAWRWRCAEVQAQHPRCRGWFGVIRVGFSSTCSTPWGPPKLNSFLYRPMISNLRFTSSVCAAAVLSVLSCWHPSERTQNSAWTRTSTWL